jgi:hypothetical protein
VNMQKSSGLLNCEGIHVPLLFKLVNQLCRKKEGEITCNRTQASSAKKEA